MPSRQDLKFAEIKTESAGMVKLAESVESIFKALAYLEGETLMPLKQRFSSAAFQPSKTFWPALYSPAPEASWVFNGNTDLSEEELSKEELLDSGRLNRKEELDSSELELSTDELDTGIFFGEISLDSREEQANTNKTIKNLQKEWEEMKKNDKVSADEENV